VETPLSVSSRRIIILRQYAGGGITVRIAWMATSAVTGNVIWSAAIERGDTGTDHDADSFASAQNSAAAAAAGTSGDPTYTEIAFTNGAQIDSLAVGEHFRIKISREASNGSDTMSGDAELLGIEIRET
jgi:hypothetical protein